MLTLGSRMTGPLAPYASGFYADLIDRGYTPSGTERHIVLMAQISHWMTETNLKPCELTPEMTDQFLALRHTIGYKGRVSLVGMASLMEYLRRIDTIPVPTEAVPTSDLDKLLDSYRAYLANERGLASKTIRGYLGVARLFASQYSLMNDARLSDLTAAEVTSFVARELRGRSTGSAQWITKGVRAFLRFLHVDGAISSPLALMVPKVASWRLRTLPKALEPAQVESLLASCNRATAIGLRDYAILTTLVRLGLRAGEVAALKLGDIDWRRGEITIHGKANREDCLPLPVDVGEAIVAWLQRGRPADSDPHVFTRACAPHRKLTAQGASDVVLSASIRAGLPPIYAHRLRHTAATQMLRAGANLTEIGQVLRHRSLGTTAIYAKVDRTSLSALARPWPGGAV